MKEINYGIIGCGQHACHHAEHTDFSAKLVAVHDPQKLHALTAAQKGKSTCIVGYDSVGALLNDIKVQAVIIASPDRFHPEHLKAAIDAGKHVFIEKPLAIDMQGMQTAIRALKKAKQDRLVVTSCHPRRFDPVYVRIKENLPEWEGLLGQAVSLHLDFSYHKPGEDWKQNRSLLLDHFPHEIDCLHFFFGYSPFKAFKLEDEATHYAVAGSREDRKTFFFSGTRKLESSVYPETVSIRFERGLITVNTKNGSLTVHNHDKGTSFTSQFGGTDYEARLNRLNLNFFNTIRGTAENYLTEGDLIINTYSAIELVEKGSTSFSCSELSVLNFE